MASSFLVRCRSWCQARSLVKRARYLEWSVSRLSEQERSQRLYRRAIVLAEPRAAATIAGLRAEAARTTAIELVSVWCSAPLRWLRARATTRPWRAAAIAAGLLVLGVGMLLFAFRVELALTPNLAYGRPWQASSAYGGLPIAGVFSRPTELVFFHTAFEPSPSITVDLGTPRRFSRIRISNRLDCCRGRAIPVVVEAGNDNIHWQRELQRSFPFEVFTGSFPTTEARYVRLRVDRPTFFHLVNVEIYR
jgi:hypothetical protein